MKAGDRFLLDFKKKDVDGDGFVTKYELDHINSLHHAGSDYAHGEATRKPPAELLDPQGSIGVLSRIRLDAVGSVNMNFEFADRNNDGQLDKTEMVTYLQPEMTEYEDEYNQMLARAKFVIADANKDGKVSREEEEEYDTAKMIEDDLAEWMMPSKT
jgi:Ca2+-binding EF-hand superfamily protein